MKKPRHSMRIITGRYVGQPFAEIPCLELVARVYADLGVPLPDEFNGITRTDWQDRWRAARRGLESMLLRFVRTLGEPADVAHLKRWDLLVCMGFEMAVFPAVYVGRGNVMTSTLKQGVAVASVKACRRILCARRLYVGH